MILSKDVHVTDKLLSIRELRQTNTPWKSSVIRNLRLIHSLLFSYHLGKYRFVFEEQE